MRVKGFSPSNNLLKTRSLEISGLNVVVERIRLLLWHGLCPPNHSPRPCGSHWGLRSVSPALLAAPTPLKYRANITIKLRAHAQLATLPSSVTGAAGPMVPHHRRAGGCQSRAQGVSTRILPVRRLSRLDTVRSNAGAGIITNTSGARAQSRQF
jgi:hypothetical protein